MVGSDSINIDAHKLLVI